jgi:LuxR family maltose regulon positive regulatory protein
VLEHLNPSLCDAVLEVEGSGEVLERLERSNLFLVPLDARGTSYRWHGMLRDILLRELLRSEPHAVPTLNARAAAWHEEAGDSEAALEYALAAGDDERVGRLLPAMAQRALNSGRIGTVRRWYDWFDRHGDPSRHTEATSLGGVLFAMAGDAGAAERWADQAARAAPAGVEDAGVRSFMLALLCRRGVDGMHVDAEAAVAALPVGHRLGTASRGLLGIAEALHGNVELGERLLEEAADGARGAPSRNTAHAIALTMASWLATRRGDRELAEARVREARRVALDGQLAEQAAGVAVAAASARLSAARGALGLVRTDVAHAQRHRGVLTYAIPWLAVRARLDLATALLAMSEPASARMLLGEIRDVLVRRPGLGLLEEEVEVLRGRLDAIRDGVVDASALTMAELRLLPLLATHLSFAEIGDRLTVSTNTVKTHAKSIYRKVDAGSRSEAIERAVAIGLLVSPTASVWLVPSD